MNPTYRPQSRLMYQMPMTALSQSHQLNTAPAPRKTAVLSARQLLDIELGLFLLTQLLPAASPDMLPDLLAGDPVVLPSRPTWSARQYRYLNRARLLLSHFRERTCWLRQVEQYATGSAFRQAYVISADRSGFGEKSVGFFRNRASSLRQMLG